MRKIFLAAALLLSLLPATAGAAVSDWQKGSSMTSWSPDDFLTSNFRRSLANLRAAHADHVAFVIPFVQKSLTASEFAPGPHTPSDEALRSAIREAHALGLKVMLKPHAQIAGSNEWRAKFEPADRAAWFASYGKMLEKYARIAQELGVEQIAIGTELINMADGTLNPDNTAQWKKIIANLRAIYSGKLTYSANWGASGWYDEKSHVGFWPDLDYIGISAYFYLTDDTNGVYTPESLRAKWDKWNTGIEALHRKYGKQILFTEVGYRSRTGALMRPPQWQTGGEANETEQADGYEALFSYWNEKPYMAGVYLWDWENDPNGGGPGDIGFTPQNKKAQDVMARWFGNGAPAGTIHAWKGEASISPAAPKAGEPASIAFFFTNLGSAAADVVADIEIFDAAKKKVFQENFAGQSFAKGESRRFSSVWTPEKPGTYAVNLAVFRGDWGEIYYWEESLKVQVGSSPIVAAGDVLIYAAEVPDAGIRGNWRKVPDPGAALGVKLKDVNDGTPKIEIARQSPANYFEATFSARANVPYHVWLRMQAEDNRFSNDSVHLQFSDSLNVRGAADYRIGTTSSLAVILEEGSGGGHAGWGWNDNHYGSLGAHVLFETDGTHTLRIQEREDGVAIDQILLSPSAYLATRPGSVKNDFTILIRGGTASSTPTSTLPTPTSTLPQTPTSTPTSTPPAVPTSTLPQAPTSTPTSTPPVIPTSTVPEVPTSTPTSTLPTGPVLPMGGIDIWWPTQTVPVGGTLPFKAMLRNASVDAYEMFWQVDGGGWNWMYTSHEDYPHKEAWVDVGPWTWRDNNHYLVNFIARDFSGTILAEQAVVIQVPR